MSVITFMFLMMSIVFVCIIASIISIFLFCDSVLDFLQKQGNSIDLLKYLIMIVAAVFITYKAIMVYSIAEYYQAQTYYTVFVNENKKVNCSMKQKMGGFLSSSFEFQKCDNNIIYSGTLPYEIHEVPKKTVMDAITREFIKL